MSGEGKTDQVEGYKGALYKGPLAGVKVIDFGHYYAGPMAAMLLADQGATVVRVVRPTREDALGELARPAVAESLPSPSRGGVASNHELPEQQFRLLNRNKKILSLDLKTPEGREQALSLIDRADVVIENFRPGVMKRLGLDYASVKSRNPGLVYLSLPGFASTDKERAHIQAWEGVIGAASCLYAEIHNSRRALGFPPVYTWVPLCSAYGAMHGAMAVVSALIARRRDYSGTCLEVPLVDAGTCAFTTGFGQADTITGTVRQLDATTKQEKRPELPDTVKPFVFDPEKPLEEQLDKLEKAQDATLPPILKYYPCADGRQLMVWTGLQQHFVPVLKKMGIYNQLRQEGFVTGNRWEPGENNLTSGMSPERAKRLSQLIGETLLTKTAEEWETELAELGPVVMARTRAEWLATKPALASGILTQMDNGQTRLTVPGRTADVSGPGGALIENGFNEAEPIDYAEAASSLENSELGEKFTTNTSLTPITKGDLLKDLKVLDMSTVVAGPMAGHTLAQLGAQVIKFDPADYTWVILNAGALDIIQGKRSLLADINTADGREIFRRLVSWADVVLHNRLDKAARRLGVAHEQLQAIKPGIVSCQITAFGGTWRGGWENRPGFDPVAASATSLQAHFSRLAYPQFHGSTACGDIMGGLALAFSAILGAYQREMTGYGGECRTSLARVNSYIQLPYLIKESMIEENGNCDWGEDHGQLAVGDHWWQRLYACADGWIYAGAHPDNSSQLAKLVLEESEVSEDEVAVEQLESAFAQQDCDHWFATLTQSGIGCHRVMSIADICSQGVRAVSNESADEKASGALEVLCWPDHPSGLPVMQPTPSWVRVGENQSYKRLTPGPKPGAHTREILEQLGYSASQIDELIRLNVCSTHHRILGPEGYFYAPG